MWHWLPPELRRLVLQCLSLPQLRLLKAVSRAMASDCRAVLRSKAWQIKGANHFALQEELKTQLQSYRLPLTVSCFPKSFPVDAPCLATVHHLRLVRLDLLGEPLNADDVATWALTSDNKDLCTIISEMCIEVHGHGICGSVTTLRQVLQEVMRARGVDIRDPVNHNKKNWNAKKVREGLWRYEVTEGDEEGCWSVDPRMCVPSPSGKHHRAPEEVPTEMVLENLVPVTEVRKGFWMLNEAPWTCESECTGGELDPLYMCQLGLKLFVR
tara:strand:- start:6176 stop:6982 length:807 start_codon:yes stop_codon:yes gene_type:complete